MTLPDSHRRDKNGHLKAGIRLPGWDYSKPWIYMITLTVKERRPILGHIADGEMINSPLGEAVAKAWRELSKLFPEVETCQYAVMPEHFHGIIWLHKQTTSPLGEIIRAFKIACTKANAALEAPALFDNKPTFWFPGLYDTILFSKGQLKAMTRYILRNAERRWAVMQNPDLFKVTRNIDIAPYIGSRQAQPSAPLGSRQAQPTAPLGSRQAQPTAPSLRRSLDIVGNAFLLELPDKMLIQVSRKATPEDIAAIIEKAVLFASRGGVVVSGCISPGEQAVAKAIREAGLPLIAIIPRGFGPYFKPHGEYFDACAGGKLLMLSPYAPLGKAEKLTRQRCFEINALAAEICGEDPAAIHYRGSQPGQLA